MSPGILMDSPATMKDGESLSQTLTESPHRFLVPTQDQYLASLLLAKQHLDPLASSTIRAQEIRTEQASRKRKRGKHNENDRSILKLKELHLHGFTVDGVWGQAKRVLDASTQELELFLSTKASQASISTRYINDDAMLDEDTQSRLVSESESDLEANNDTQSVDMDEEIVASGGEGETNEKDTESDQGEDIMADSDLGEGIESDSSEPQRSSIYKQDPNGLNDGFFDIDEFNKDTDFLEQADANGRDDGAASDEEDVDWDANPLGQDLAAQASRGQDLNSNEPGRHKELDGSDGEEEEEGPTFGNADLNAPWSDEDDEEDEVGDVAFDQDDEGADNTNDVRYEDFFEPPPRALTKSKRMRALPKTQPNDTSVQPSSEELQRTIDSHRRDLFDDDFSDPDASGDEEMDEDAPGLKNLSTHERKRIALAKQIRELEAASVQKREWQLSGEATAHARPENALLEEDLEFERTGKPVPVITADVSLSIEDIIKQRILSKQFDEVIKRRPGTQVGSALGAGQPRRGLMELSDQKDNQGLGEAYEQAYLTQNDPGAPDPRSEALKRQHAEIEELWTKVSGQLDALTSWRYKPKPPGVEVKVVTDAPKILMEDARPSGVEGIGDEQGGLAPQEVYRVGDARKTDGEEGIVATRAGGVFASDELSREDKQARRKREKERAKKHGASSAADSQQPLAKQDAVPTGSRKKVDEDEVLKTLKAGGVQVVGKGGKLQNIDDKAKRRP